MSAESLLQNILRVARDFISDGLSALDALDELDMSVSRSISNIEVGVIGLDFMEESNHSGSCRCDLCLQWWATLGPDDDGKYGPFIEAEVSAAKVTALALQEVDEDA